MTETAPHGRHREARAHAFRWLCTRPSVVGVTFSPSTRLRGMGARRGRSTREVRRHVTLDVGLNLPDATVTPPSNPCGLDIEETKRGDTTAA